MKQIAILFLLFFCSQTIISQSFNDTVPLTKKNNRLKIASFSHAGIIVGTLATLNWVWYSKEERQPLASFDDSKEWLQMDKIGHSFSTYSEAKLSTAIWKWSGMPHKKAVIYGSTGAWLYQFSFELMDGTMKKYGFSWTDIATNTLGSGLFAFQQLQWGEDRIVPKLSYWREKYDPSVLARVRSLYGTNGLERFLKDYNGQTHWLSVHLKSFFKKSKFPDWLNISVGYGASGMLGGFENQWKDTNGNTITRYDIKRTRHWYLSPDLNFSKIKTKKKGLKILFFVLNSVKFPAPGLELVGGKLKIRGLIF